MSYLTLSVCVCVCWWLVGWLPAYSVGYVMWIIIDCRHPCAQGYGYRMLETILAAGLVMRGVMLWCASVRILCLFVMNISRVTARRADEKLAATGLFQGFREKGSVSISDGGGAGLIWWESSLSSALVIGLKAR
eukprot:TRINITY_DN4221_c0_g1_i4.p1 TRINITY_DN4221_c0_g1~~TRINITY_DN4221_c0_g1_i4.p1  ORF type:complete len:134 (-),score=3.65 TRINITY_DN4221_c0_g1_i4:280-681(-)